MAVGSESTNRADILQELRDNVTTEEQINELAEYSGYSPAKVEMLIKTDSLSSLSDVLYLHQSYQKFQKEKKLKADMLTVMREYFKFHPTKLFDLAELAKLTPQQIEYLIYGESKVEFSVFVGLHTIFQTMTNEKDKKAEAKLGGM